VPHAAVRDAAIFDLLFLQGDRHGENIFLGRSGAYFKLIDRCALAAGRSRLRSAVPTPLVARCVRTAMTGR
jgi:hypothetical protein